MWNQRRRRTTSRGSNRGLRNLSQEETEELGFVPSAVSEPQWALHIVRPKCREESFRFFQLVAIVTEEGGAVHTINLCKQCYNERRLKQGEQPVKAAQWRELMKQKAFRGQLRVALWHGAISAKNVGCISPSKKPGPKHSLRMLKKKGRKAYNAAKGVAAQGRAATGQA